MHADMSFDGQRLTWSGSGVFKATSGMVGFQMPTNDCVPDAGPTPKGLYKVYVADRGVAKDDGNGTCNLLPAWGVQSIPRGADASPTGPTGGATGFDWSRPMPSAKRLLTAPWGLLSA